MSELTEALGHIGLGTFPFSGPFSSVSQNDAAEIVRLFLAGGGRYIETAYSYPVREVSLGDILRDHPRESYVLGTKCVMSTAPDGSKVRSGARDVILKQCEEEMSRLGVEYLDVFQAHVTPEDVEPAVTMAALHELKGQGLVRWVGVSNVDLHQLRAFEQGGPVELVQNRMSMVHDGSHSELVAHCTEAGICFNQYQAIERGLLTTQTAGRPERRAGDLRESKPEYVGEPYHVIHTWFLKEVVPIAEDFNVRREALSIAWVLAQPCVACCVVGATRPEQVEWNLSGDFVIPPAMLSVLEQRRASLAKKIRAQYGVRIEEFRGTA